MGVLPAAIEIPDRPLFKAAEVCELLRVQPYVLRSWEAEFPGLGVAKAAGGPRVYRRADVEQVLRIRHLLLVDGLTLAGARRRIEEDIPPVAPDTPVQETPLGRDVRQRVAEVRQGLRSLLELLGRPILARGGETPDASAVGTGKGGPVNVPKIPARGRTAATRPDASPRRRRSA